MSGIVRFKDGAWRIRVEAGPDPVTGKRRHVYATHHGPDNKVGERAARKLLGELEVQVSAGRAAPKSGMTVAELIERYIVDAAPRKRWSPGAADETRARVARHITPWIGGKPIEKVRPLDITDLHRRWYDAGLAGGTVGRMHDILRAAFKQAIRWELIVRNPTDPIERPQGEVREIVPPKPKAVARALVKADATLTLYLRLAALTGARRGQIVALRWSAIDVKGGQLRYTRALVQTKGAIIEKDTKSGTRYAVALDPATVALLTEHRARQAEQALVAGVPLRNDAYLFAFDPAGTRPWRPDSASHRWATLRSKIKGLEGARLHDLRHWMATELMAGGFDVVESAGRGGWADASMLTNRYGHFQPARDRAAAEHLAARLDG